MEHRTKEKCPICLSETTSVEHSGLFDDRYGFPGVFEIAKCASCKHRFSLPKLGQGELARVYEFYGRRTTTSAKILEEATKSANTPWIQRLLTGTNNLGQHFAPAGSKLLDVGSGDCSNLLEATILGFDSVGFDVDKESQRLGKELGLRVQLAESPKALSSNEAFSWIQLNQVIEHFIDPVNELGGIRRILTHSGKVFLATPNVSSLSRRLSSRKWINWHVPYHQHHFSRSSLEVLAKKSGLEIQSWRTVTPNVWAKLQFATLFAKQMQGAPSPLWSKNVEIHRTNVGGLLRKVLNVLSLIASPFLTVMLRIVDWIGMGDCHVVILKVRI